MADVVATSTSSWPSRREWGLIAVFWIALGLLSIGRGILDPHDGAAGWAQAPDVAIRVATEYVFWILITPIVFRLVEAFPLERPIVLRNVFLHLVLAFLLSVGVDLGEGVLRDACVAGAIGPVGVLESLRRFWFLNELMVYTIILLTGIARSYYLQKKKRQEEAERLEQRAQALETKLTEARLEALRMQLNPHFLFNTLHAVSTLVDRDPEGVRRMIARLSELLRHVLDEEAPQEVPLSQELDFLEDYLQIQSIRFQGDLDTEVDVPSELGDAQVPNLILQPVVENAIKHGASQVRGVGKIIVRGHRSGDKLVITVTDNGPGLPHSQEDGLGLRNVRARLEELYGDEQALRLESTPDEGTRATLEIPYHTRTALYTAEGDATLTTVSAAD